MQVQSLRADARSLPIPSESVNCCVTSPPYWGLRDYGVEPSVWGDPGGCEHEWGEALVVGGPAQAQGATSQRVRRSSSEEQRARGRSQGTLCGKCGAWLGCLGLEPTPGMYVSHMVEVGREIRRVLRKDGTFWLNIGDCYATGAGAAGGSPGGGQQGVRWSGDVSRHRDAKRRDHGRPDRNGRGEPQVGGHKSGGDRGIGPMTQPNRLPIPGLKPKDVVGVPWRVAFALQADGWFLRMDVIWNKPNPMPESVTDRPTKAHEYVFLLSKSADYFYDAAAIAEPATPYGARRRTRPTDKSAMPGAPVHRGLRAEATDGRTTRNKRSVWNIAVGRYEGAHFAVMPEELAETCVLAGCPAGGTVLDCFGGSGTTARAAVKHGRNAILSDMNPEYVSLQGARTSNVQIDLLTSRRQRG